MKKGSQIRADLSAIVAESEPSNLVSDLKDYIVKMRREDIRENDPAMKVMTHERTEEELTSLAKDVLKLNAPDSFTRPVRMPNWWHWQIYKLFRWAWNPIFANNRPMRQGFGKALLQWKEDDAERLEGFSTNHRKKV
jgi:hypothetical protein